MIECKEYIDKLILRKDEQVIKVVTGIHRCGKSTLLNLYKENLRKNGVTDKRIVSVNFEELENEELLDYNALYEYLIKKIQNEKTTYIFLDEVQKLNGFEKVIDSLYVKKNVDLYIIGSNSCLLSSELATLLSGRYVEIKMLPFSFKEYTEAKLEKNTETAFSEYMENGSFPYIATILNTKEKVGIYFEGIYTVTVKDVEERQKRKNSEGEGRKVNDISLLKNITRYIASVIGSPVSGKRNH